MMSGATILAFPRLSIAACDNSCDRFYQGDLFRDEGISTAAFSFISVDEIDQDILFRILTRNEVKSIIDIRRRPVFRNPRYIHKDVTGYFSKNSISYFEFAMIDGGKFYYESIINNVSSAVDQYLSNNISLFLYDDGAINDGTYDCFKSVVHSKQRRAVEILPRSLR